MKSLLSISYLIVCITWLVLSVKMYKSFDDNTDSKAQKKPRKYSKAPSKIRVAFDRVLFNYRIRQECKKDYYKLV